MRITAALFALLVVGCRSPSLPVDGGGGACHVDTDCGPARLCGFPESAACGAEGQCFPSPGAICNADSPGCACDGTVINIACTGLPAGYASKPLAHPGECTDGCTAASPCLSTVTCTSDDACAVVLGSKCDPCMKLCGCGNSGSGCCPVAWDLIPCTYPDGGAGFNCHDPALGCASSTTCGAGCDVAVSGRCDGG